MPDHADSLDDALDISLDRAGGVDLELIARLADTTVEEAEAGLGDRIIRDPDTGEVMPAEDYLAGDVGTKCFASMFVRQVRQCFSAVWADGFPRCRHRFPVM